MNAIDRIKTPELSVEQIRAYLIPVIIPEKIFTKADIKVLKPELNKYDALMNGEAVV